MSLLGTLYMNTAVRQLWHAQAASVDSRDVGGYWHGGNVDDVRDGVALGARGLGMEALAGGDM